MDDETKNRLLQSIEADRLVVFCGAGLSMAAPSNLPAAWQVAEKCHQSYCAIDPGFDPALRFELEAIAEHFANAGTLISTFIRTLVPWEDFRRPSNLGHEALADLLYCRGVQAVLSANYDDLIEHRARANGADLQVALDGDEAILHQRSHSPLLKFHGCTSNRDHTVWIKSQLADDETVVDRMERTRVWMNAHLREKDLLVIGFWTDWSYLNEIIGNAITNVTPLSICVVDPIDVDKLEEKAPELWNLAQADNVSFHHIKMSGAEMLDDLRKEFSKVYMRKVNAFGRNAIVDQLNIEFDNSWLEMPDLESSDYYRWRRDAEGIGSKLAPRSKQPSNNPQLGFFHLLMRKEGAVMEADGYKLGNRKIRVINGSGKYLHDLRSEMIEPPSAANIDLAVCVGAENTGLPADFVRSGSPGSILRPASEGEFVTHNEARELLEI